MWQAFTAYDFKGTNYVTVDDFLNAKINYRLPFTRDELKYLLENETVFKRYDRINIDQFVKNFFPDSSATDPRDSNSSGDDHSLNRSLEPREDETDPKTSQTMGQRSSTEGDLFSMGGSSLSGSLKQQKVAEQVKQLEAEIKKRLGANFNSVRKAFLELDEVHKGSIGAEELAKFIGASKKANFDFTVLEILVKMRTKGMVARINYADFVSWLGSSIQPTENFYLRHDSKKNPQYQLNLQRIAEKHTPF